MLENNTLSVFIHIFTGFSLIYFVYSAGLVNFADHLLVLPESKTRYPDDGRPVDYIRRNPPKIAKNGFPSHPPDIHRMTVVQYKGFHTLDHCKLQNPNYNFH